VETSAGTRVGFNSEIFRFEKLGFEELQEDFYKIFFRDVEIGEFDVEIHEAGADPPADLGKADEREESERTPSANLPG
jgi:hypothetical protein